MISYFYTREIVNKFHLFPIFHSIIAIALPKLENCCIRSEGFNFRNEACQQRAGSAVPKVASDVYDLTRLEFFFSHLHERFQS